MPDPTESSRATFRIDDDHHLRSPDHDVEQLDVCKDDDTLQPDAIVIHFTAGASAASSARHLADPEVEASAHLVIGRRGELIQITPFDRIAWHAGTSEYRFADGQLRRHFNGFSIGIEIDNPGELTESLGGYQTWFGRTVQPADVIKAVHRNQSLPSYWHAYTEIQIELTRRICRALIDRYRIKHILGHEEIAPDRKVDPGPAFPLDRMRTHLLAGNRRDDVASDLLPRQGRVTASKLNIRAGAMAGSEKVARPLQRGTPVTAVREQNGWYLVRAQVEGWVDGRFVELETD